MCGINGGVCGGDKPPYRHFGVYIADIVMFTITIIFQLTIFSIY